MQILKKLRAASIALALATLTSTLNAEVTHISNEKTDELLKAGVPLIDVRTQAEWQQTGIVEGSHLLTFFDERGNYDIEKWLAELGKVTGKDEPFMLICAVGGRTGSISQFLDNKLGFSKVHNVERGIIHWIEKDQPVIDYEASLMTSQTGDVTAVKEE